MKLKLIRALFTPLTLVVIALWGVVELCLSVRDALSRKLGRTRR